MLERQWSRYTLKARNYAKGRGLLSIPRRVTVLMQVRLVSRCPMAEIINFVKPITEEKLLELLETEIDIKLEMLEEIDRLTRVAKNWRFLCLGLCVNWFVCMAFILWVK